MKKFVLFFLMIAMAMPVLSQPVEDITGKGISQKSLYFVLNQMKNSINNSVATGTFGVSVSTGTFAATDTIRYYINGSYTTRVASTSFRFSNGHSNLTASQTCFFALCLNSVGSFSTYQGPILSIPAATWVEPRMPIIPNEVAVVALARVHGAFIPNTTTMVPGTNVHISPMRGEPIRLINIPK